MTSKNSKQATKRPARASSAAGYVPDEPRGEFLTASAVIAGLSFGYSVAKKELVPRLLSGSSAIVNVLDSVFNDGIHFVEFKVTNCTQHGLYLDRLKIPGLKTGTAIMEVIADDQGPVTRNRMGWDDSSDKVPGQNLLDPNPLDVGSLIPAAESVFFMLAFAEDKLRSHTASFGSVELTLSPLHEKKPTTANFTFRLRR